MDIAVIKGITENVQLFLRDEFQWDLVAMFPTHTQKHICSIIPSRPFLNGNLIKNENLVFNFAAIHIKAFKGSKRNKYIFLCIKDCWLPNRNFQW